jgi:hypothetical protein
VEPDIPGDTISSPMNVTGTTNEYPSTRTAALATDMYYLSVGMSRVLSLTRATRVIGEFRTIMIVNRLLPISAPSFH